MQSTNFNLYMGAERQLSCSRPLVLLYKSPFQTKALPLGFRKIIIRFYLYQVNLGLNGLFPCFYGTNATQRMLKVVIFVFLLLLLFLKNISVKLKIMLLLQLALRQGALYRTENDLQNGPQMIPKEKYEWLGLSQRIIVSILLLLQKVRLKAKFYFSKN